MKLTIIAIVLSIFIIGGSLFIVYSTPSASEQRQEAEATIVDGKQIVEITAKGGYRPAVTLAKADIPTVIKVSTEGTFDCSAALAIPALKYQTILVPSGVTEVQVPPQKSGTVLRGLCAMGMYNFAIRFE